MKTTRNEDSFGSKKFNRWRKARTARTIRRSVRCAIRQDLRACYTLVRCWRSFWRASSDAADVERAQTYARQNDYVVFTYPTTEPEPLQRARLDV